MLESGFSVALAIRTTPVSMSALCSQSAIRSTSQNPLHLFKARLDDENYVHVLPHSPFDGGDEDTNSSSALSEARTPPSQLACVDITLDKACENVLLMTVRMDVVDVGAKASLSGGAVVQHQPAGIVDHGAVKLRIARKSSYIEVKLYH